MAVIVITIITAGDEDGVVELRVGYGRWEGGLGVRGGWDNNDPVTVNSH